MPPCPNRNRYRNPKTVLRLPDLEQSRCTVLNSLTSASSQRAYDYAIRDFIDWYCSEPRLAFNKTVVTRYRISLEQARYAASTINLRLAAVRRLAYEASDAGLLSPDLAAGIRRVRGAKKHGVRLGDWLASEQGKRPLAVFDSFCIGKGPDIDYIRRNSEARVWAECCFVAEPKRAQALAVELCGRLVDVFRFWMAATSAQKNFPVGIALEGDFANGSRMQIVRSPDGGVIWDHSPARGLAPLAVGARLMETTQPAHCLLSFAFEPGKQTSFCRLIMHAVRSFGKGKVSPHGEDRVLGYMIALEAFLNEKNIPLTESVSEGAATIRGGPFNTRLQLKKDLKRIYGFRSQIAHGENFDNLDAGDVRLLENTVIAFILAMIGMRDHFKSKKEFLAALERKRIS